MDVPAVLSFSKFLFAPVLAWLVLRSSGRVARKWVRIPAQAVSSLLFGMSVLLLLLTALLQFGCTKTLVVSQAPNRSATARIKEFCTLPDCVVEVTLQTGWLTEKTIVQRSDCVVSFAHVAWSADSRFAAFFVDNLFCSSIHEGYDLKTSSATAFEPLSDLVRRSILEEYRISPEDLTRYGGDPLEWAHYPGDGVPRPGPQAFRQKHDP